jgi:sulfur carrier protein
MNVKVNGEQVSLAPGTTIQDIVVASGRRHDARGIAVAVNGEVVPRRRWSERTVSEDDSVEVLAAIGGG